MEQKTTNKQELINKILGIINGEIPAKRNMLCILWDEENPDNEENIYLIDSKKVNYTEWNRINKRK